MYTALHDGGPSSDLYIAGVVLALQPDGGAQDMVGDVEGIHQWHRLKACMKMSQQVPPSQRLTWTKKS